jgi:hypothetical protein
VQEAAGIRRSRGRGVVRERGGRHPVRRRPSTHITFGAHDHRGYKGDYLVMRHLVDQQHVGLGGLEPRHRV